MITGGIKQHAGLWLAASANRAEFVRAIVNGVYPSVELGQVLFHALVQQFQVNSRNQSFCHAALIADNDHLESCFVQLRNAIGDAWQDLHLFPTGDIAMAGRLPIDDAVTIKKRRSSHEPALSQK